MKNYIKQLKKNITFIKQFKLAIMLSFIVAAIDVLNLPSKLINTYNLTVSILLFAVIVVLAVLTIIESGVLDAYKIKAINQIDAFNCTILLSILIYLVIIFFVGELCLYKKIVVAFSVVVMALAIAIRIYYFNIGIKNAQGYKTNFVDLKKLYEGNVQLSIDEPVLLSEKDVDYDLLNRGSLVGFICDTITSVNPDSKFVISLEGEWGSGKTTIINNVKKLISKNYKDIVIIDEFDPWIYEDETTLFEDMFNLILQKSDLKYKFLSVSKMARDLSELVFGTKKNRFLQSFFLDKNIGNLKVQINDYLRRSEKKYVFIVDNIDRAEKENIILLFKIIGNILDFDRITYVLSFDDKKVKKIFETDLNLDYEYLKKIINLPIRIPEMDQTNLNNIYDKCLKRILVLYGETEDKINDYNSIIEFLCKKCFGIRDFKRFVNAAVNYSIKTNHYLNKKDLLIIELLKLHNYPLYQAIYDNREYFISHDKTYDIMIYSKSLNADSFNKVGKTFYEELFSSKDNRDYSCLLEEMFPYVKKFNSGQDLVYAENIIIEDSEYDNISKEKRICSAKYFDLYFTLSSNAYVEIANLVASLIETINTEQSIIYKEECFVGFLNSVHRSYHKEIFERLQLYLEEIEEDYILDFIKMLHKNLEHVDTTPQFLSLSVDSRIAFIIYILLNKISAENYNEYIRYISKRYNRLSILQNILSYFNQDNESISIDDRKERLEETINNMAADILNLEIDIYSDDNYIYRNIWALYRVFKDNISELKDYVELILNENNVYRFLYDMANVSVGSGYRYSIDKSTLEIFTTSDFINSILKPRRPKSEDEEFVLRVYKSFLNGNKDESGEPGVVMMESKKLLL